MRAAQAKSIDPEEMLGAALLKAGKDLGITQVQLGRIIGKDRTSIARGLDPESKSGELALLLIRCHRSLFVLTGGDPQDMKHWMHTENLHLGGIPAEQLLNIQGLSRVTEYLDAIRGKV